MSDPAGACVPSFRPSLTTRAPGRGRVGRALLVAVLLLASLAVPGGLLAGGPSDAGPPSILWGASVADHPLDPDAMPAFVAAAGRAPAIVNLFQQWSGERTAFDSAALADIRAAGAIPMVTWEPWRFEVEDPEFTLASIIRGDHDEHILAWARAAAAFGHPLFLRFAHEMNGDWTPWSELANGNAPGEFVRAWIRVHDLMTRAGATNLTWVWCPNPEDALSLPFEDIYPGDRYVDWTCLDIYNWGLSQTWSRWESFEQATRASYDHLLELAPDKPVMLAELAASELGGDKAHWIRDALAVRIPYDYAAIRAIVWFEFVATGADWRITSSPRSEAAFREAIAAPWYAEASFADLAGTPIEALPVTPLPPRPAEPAAPDPGVNLLPNGSFDDAASWLHPWQLNVSVGGRASIAPEESPPPATAAGPRALRIDVLQADAVDDWVVELDQKGLDLVADGRYRWSFQARASVPRTVRLSVQAAYAPYETYWSEMVELGTSWSTFAFDVDQARHEPDAQVVFNLGGALGSVWLDDVVFRQEG